ncbi:GH92 family glycosyl hydrolase [Paenibacillus sp. FSL W8-1187]|uniref:GH92 family glycosyl hydrolase n=1 Tax=unclassified Paenibacillus TaxID=185978 RepID=UPI00129BCD98|nr:GH92 family glycosyl hydrolase [Paenibacillus sp. B01]QGG54743.1 glycoside hydrolase family 92 protein [Paenibacillus sp. B01]
MNHSLAELVRPHIGGVGHLLTSTSPVSSLPHGMMKLAPITTPGMPDRYLADHIYGFPVGHGWLMPACAAEAGQAAELRSLYDHELETARPHRYEALLEDEGIAVQLAVTAQAAIYRFVYPPGSSRVLSLGAPDGIAAEAAATEEAAVGGKLGGAPLFAALRFSERPLSVEPWSGAGKRGLLLRFGPAADGVLEVRVGLSQIDAEQARRNREREVAALTLEQAAAAAEAAWNDALGRISVRGGTAAQQSAYYTALYRSLLNMSDVTEEGRYYSGCDDAVHELPDDAFYIRDQMWDAYRCHHPLQLLLDPQRKEAMIRSYLRMYQQCGWLPQFPYPQGDLPIMTGNHAAAMIWDAYAKGLRGFDAELAYEAMRKNAMEVTMLPWVHGPLTELDRVYLEQGFFPALRPGEAETVPEVDGFERRQAVAVTLEHAYDDWCVAQMAQALGKEEDYRHFLERGQNYRHLYRPDIGFMAPRAADGSWIEPFDPKFGGGLGGRDYFSECNAWIYSFHVQHDIEGLIGLMGGPEAFEQRLDQLFQEPYDGAKYRFLGLFPDSTGLIGQYCQGNEPAFHIPYLYNYTRSPWKTQRRLRQIMDLWYHDHPLGLCGDEDNGALSSWYAFSAIGLYPICPGKPFYEIGSPLFEEIDIALPGGGTFRIAARGASARRKYIQSAMLNGEPLHVPRIAHDALAAGGELVLEMGERPNRAWGLGAPPS